MKVGCPDHRTLPSAILRGAVAMTCTIYWETHSPSDIPVDHPRPIHTLMDMSKGVNSIYEHIRGGRTAQADLVTAGPTFAVSCLNSLQVRPQRS